MPERPLAVCRELTKAFEEVVRGPARDLAARFRAAPKGEITLVIGPAKPQRLAEQAGLEAVAELVAAGMARRKSAEIVSRLTGLSRNRLYRGSL
jgi:16S rRNA (cytidine1402-2'-O)-methyltransferase